MKCRVSIDYRVSSIYSIGSKALCFLCLFWMTWGFLATPVKVKQTVDDLVLNEGRQFLNLPVNLALRSSASLKDFL
ncbi:unnamed protein product [Ceratitis capitata]|uniref:(Mediterranean fruit fly) hypothetical protein n=1 Tax=Ceratitis capitata TaxID=7213 RepID=A0A811URR3_CERCA|nr:unnamed protein product [Ceratitis capitata]